MSRMQLKSRLIEPSKRKCKRERFCLVLDASRLSKFCRTIFPDEIQKFIYRDFNDPSKHLSSLLGLSPIGIIPGIFEEFLKDNDKLNKLLLEKHFPTSSQGTCPEVIRPPKSFDRNEILKRKQKVYEPGTREWIFDTLINNIKERHAAFLLSPLQAWENLVLWQS